MSRGPYRKPSKLAIRDNTWRRHDVVQVGRRRWIIRQLDDPDDPTSRVVLWASNPTNHDIRWTTTLDKLPKKAARE